MVVLGIVLPESGACRKHLALGSGQCRYAILPACAEDTAASAGSQCIVKTGCGVTMLHCVVLRSWRMLAEELTFVTHFGRLYGRFWGLPQACVPVVMVVCAVKVTGEAEI